MAADQGAGLERSDTQAEVGSPPRIAYLDNLRALAMLLGVLFHGSLAYGDRLRELWLVRDSVGTPVLDVLALLSHLFRMALFFLIAGFFAKLLVKRRGVGGFLKNRLLRIALPFAIFLPPVTIAYLLVFRFMSEHLSELAPIMQAGVERTAAGQPAPPKTTHLWFLYHLSMFCLLGAALACVRMPVLQRAFGAFFRSTWHLAYAPLLLVPALANTSMPAPAPDLFRPQLWSFGYYGVFFLVGWQLLEHHREYVHLLDRQLGKLLPAGLIAAGALIAIVLRSPLLSPAEALAREGVSPAFSPTHAIQLVLEAYASVYLAFSALCLGRRFLDSTRPALRYMSDASYWIYIVHLPLVLYLQTLLAEKPWSVWFKFALCALGTLALSTLSYALLVRHTPLGSLLNGKRQRLRVASRAVVAE